MNIDIKLLIATLIAGVIGAFADVILYNAMIDTVSQPFLIALLVLVFAIILCVTISVVMAIAGNGSDSFFFLEGRTALSIALAVCLVLVFLLSMLLEWIYDTDHQVQFTDTSYIFVLDESGSMDTNDPSLERYSAVSTVMQTMPDTFPYAVYMFSNTCVQIRPMADASAGPLVRPADADETMMGSTYILNALEVVYQDIQSGNLNAGNHPHVILLTDGCASDMSIFTDTSILRQMNRANVRVSTVGLGVVDEYLMQKIANKTGGSFLTVSDASQLASGFTSVATVQSQRDLLSVRNTVSSDFLYLLLRILFLTLIGGAVACMKAIACGDDTIRVLLVGLAAAFVGALIVELGLLLGLPEAVAQFIYWLLLSVTVRSLPKRTYRYSSGSMQMQSPFVSHGGSSGSSGGKIKW